MKLIVTAVALVALAALIGLGTYYAWVGGELDDIEGRLVTEAQLQAPDDPATAAAIAAAPAQCARVYDLRADPVARRLRGDEIRALWAKCEKIADLAAGRATPRQ